MISVRLEMGMKNVEKNKRKLMKEGMSEKDAYAYAYTYARRHTTRRFNGIRRSRKEQRLR